MRTFQTDLLNENELGTVRKFLNNELETFSGISQLLFAKMGHWEERFKLGVVTVVKNDMKFFVMDYTNDKMDAQLVFRTLIDENLSVTRPHDKLAVLKMEREARIIGFNFHSKSECALFMEIMEEKLGLKIEKEIEEKHPEVTFRKDPLSEKPVEKNEKDKTHKSGIRKSLMSIFVKPNKKKFSSNDISEPSGFKHVEHCGLNDDQEELYRKLLKKVDLKNDEEKEILRQVVAKNSEELRKSLIRKPREKKMKKDRNAPLVTLKESPAVPQQDTVKSDPLKPDWGDDGNMSSEVVYVKDAPPPPSRFQSLARDTFNKTTNRESYRWAVTENSVSSEDYVRAEMPSHPPPPLHVSSRKEKDSSTLSLPSTDPESKNTLESDTEKNVDVEQLQQEEKTPSVIVKDTPRESKSIPPPAPPLPVNPFQNNNNGDKLTAVNADRKLLLDEIQNADPSKLLKVTPKSPPAARDERQCLLEEIQKVGGSRTLRKVSERSIEPRSSSVEGDILRQIQKCLDARRLGISPSDEESDESTDEWDD